MVKRAGSDERKIGVENISIIVPYYNSSETISYCLESLENLSPSPKEIILVDNNSTDGSSRLVDHFIRKRRKSNFVHLHEKKRGPSAARNTGCHRARGEILVFTDSDVIVPPDWAASIAESVNRYKSAAGAGRIMPSSPENTVQKFLGIFSLRTFDHPFESTKFTLTGGGFAAANLWLNRSILKKIVGWDETLLVAEDYDIEARLYSAGYTIHYDPEVRVTHIHRKNLKGLINQSKNYGAGRPIMMRRYFPQTWLINIASKEIRMKLPSGVWIDLNGMDKKMLLLIIAGILYPPLLALPPLYFIIASIRMGKRAKKMGFGFKPLEYLTMPLLMLIKSSSMTWGALKRSARERAICL
jgi:glycosyltransferase involved in cell wall biosynthesis